MRIHLIGIGGIGVSALAQYYIAKGHKVGGSDLVASETTDFLKEKGAKVFIGKNSGKNIKSDLDLLIYTPAVKPENPEFKQAENLGVKTKSYPEALGDLTKEYFTIAVSGTHGKSTTTSMIALALEKAGLDPTVVVGTKLKEFGDTNFRAGKSKILVIEADEHFASFLNYWPKIIVLTNIEREHLDFYKNLKNILNSYKKYVSHLGRDGFLVANENDENISKVISKIEKPEFKIINYGIKNKEAGKLKKILKIPGQHNIYNALAVLAVTRILHIPDKIVLKSLSEFNGTWRRFEEREAKVENYKVKIISDYGHHPTEVLATLNAAREKYKNKKIWCVFQPHQHQRTFYLFNDFVKAFREAPIDNIIITNIYDVAGRETKKINAEVSAEKLVKKINKKSVLYLPLCDIEKFVKENIKSGDVLIIMGAGDIYKLADKF